VNLPVAVHDGDLLIIDQDTGEAFPIGQASDHTLAAAMERIAEFDRDLFTAKRAVAAELRARHGVGKSVAGGYEFTVAESQSWPVGAVTEAMSKLLEEGRISAVDHVRALPVKPHPDPRQLKSLIGRLTVTDPEAATLLAAACTVSPASVRGVKRTAVTAEENR
jgi:hypothetical protein